MLRYDHPAQERSGRSDRRGTCLRGALGVDLVGLGGCKYVEADDVETPVPATFLGERERMQRHLHERTPMNRPRQGRFAVSRPARQKSAEWRQAIPRAASCP